MEFDQGAPGLFSISNIILPKKAVGIGPGNSRTSLHPFVMRSNAMELAKEAPGQNRMELAQEAPGP